MGTDLTLYKVVLYGEDTVKSEFNIFPSDYRPYIVQVEMMDMLMLWERVGEGDDWFPMPIDVEECENCPVTESIIDCGKCPLGLKLDYSMMAKRGNKRIKVTISHEVVEQCLFNVPFWAVKVKEICHCGVGYCGSNFLVGTSPFGGSSCCNDDHCEISSAGFEYPRIYHTPGELDVFRNNLINDFHREHVAHLQKEFKKALEINPNVFVWGSY